MDIPLFLAAADEPTRILGIVVNPWKVVGLTGNLVFGCRFLLQWIASERAGRSVIPRAFWIVSALGSCLLLSYFVFYRQDSVGVLSVAFPLPIYLRNLWLQARHDKLTAAQSTETSSPQG